MSYNLHDLRDDRTAAARVVRAVDPDVLCLQEVPRRLTTELRLPPFARACGLRWDGRRLGTGGTAVLTGPRVVVHGSRRGRLPVRFPDRTRGYAVATVSLPGGGATVAPVDVVSVHLGLKAPERVRHAAALLATLSARAVVAGDLNEGADGAAHRLVAARLPVVSSAEATFPADRPSVVIDVVFASPGLSRVPGATVELPERDLASGSDHRPVWVDLDLRPRPA
ncbi:endonuclease/exonuclease/phosphatase family protein [Terrabacter sp. NPDC000476]|uniref:endonuclease/exonuclease/phosphatase family protein n=1 Tax=Terrabacter sp. NPDC000476 TaxID=3154258 RepID=UPI00332DC88C